MKKIVRRAWIFATILFIFGASVSAWWYLYAKPFRSALRESTVAKIESISDIERLRSITLQLNEDRGRLDRDVNIIVSAAVDLVAAVCAMGGVFIIFIAVRARQAVSKETRDV